jgi:fused signal recognition particle receptor
MSGFLGRLRQGLARSTQKLTAGIGAALAHRKLDDAALQELEDALIAADLGPAVAADVVANLRRTRFGREVTEPEIRSALAGLITPILAPVAHPLAPNPAHRPHVVLMVGVNGTGKTTTIGKLAQLWRGEGKHVILAAADTFRAAAVEQLQVWGQRTGCEVVAGAPGADPAGLAYTALERARNDNADILLIDTAGRLHNKTVLMEELAKIVRVINKLDPTAPHDIVLVLDATTGQNAIAQVEIFRALIAVTGLVVTKLDGSARGGIVVALARKFALPVHAVGVGEAADDLRPFDPAAFAADLVGEG